VLTNIGLDHRDMPDLLCLFADYVSRAELGAVMNLDCEKSLPLTHAAKAVRTFSLEDSRADFAATRIVARDNGVAFCVNGCDITLPLPGRHNAANALAAIAAASWLDIPCADAASALATFRGIRRRLEVVGQARGVTVLDDFAHNPDKIAASLDALHTSPGTVTVIFQPHGYAPLRRFRTELADAFAGHLNPDDRLLLLDVFFAGGTVQRDVTSADLAAELVDRGSNASVAPDRDSARSEVVSTAVESERIVVMGARDDTLTDFALSILKELNDAS
jgi:UDP-N-acetylmuramate--alanine ligase